MSGEQTKTAELENIRLDVLEAIDNARPSLVGYADLSAMLFRMANDFKNKESE